MKIAAIESFRLRPKIIKEAWQEEAYVWPSTLPSFLVKVTAEDSTYGAGTATIQVWHLGETAEQMDPFLDLYHGALKNRDAENIALCHQLMEAKVSGGMPGGQPPGAHL